MNDIDVHDVDRTHAFAKRYMDKLEELNYYRTNGCLHVIESLIDEINTVSKKILLLAKEDEIASLLMTIPGTGYYSASLIISEVGDINGFPGCYPSMLICRIGTT